MRFRIRNRTRRLLGQALVPAYLVAAIVLGGASAAGYSANLLLQLGAIALLFLSALVHPDVPLGPPGRQLVALTWIIILVGVIQLIPLPPAVWTSLPGRAAVAANYRLLELPLPWLPLTLAPINAGRSLLWLLPALAILFATLRMGAYRTKGVTWAVAGAAVGSVALGAMQLGGGPQSSAYLYRFTNYGAAVGFFANANHLGTLMLMTLPFLLALLSGKAGRRYDRRQASAGVLLTGVVLLVVVVGLLITMSLAAIGLAVPVAAASGLLLLNGRRRMSRWALPVIVLLGIAAIGITLSQPFGNNLTGKDARDPTSRRTAYINTLDATADYFPVGSGLGTFVDVYRQTEDPAAVTTVYMNHAHSDPLEILLETGLVGVVLMLLLFVWWVRRTMVIWLGEDADVWAKAATIASGAVLAHSFVDYPLRTAAISALFAYCLALMAGARERSFGRGNPLKPARHLAA